MLKFYWVVTLPFTSIFGKMSRPANWVKIAVADPKPSRHGRAYGYAGRFRWSCKSLGGPSAFAELMSSIYGYAFAEAKVKKISGIKIFIS